MREKNISQSPCCVIHVMNYGRVLCNKGIPVNILRNNEIYEKLVTYSSRTSPNPKINLFSALDGTLFKGIFLHPVIVGKCRYIKPQKRLGCAATGAFDVKNVDWINMT